MIMLYKIFSLGKCDIVLSLLSEILIQVLLVGKKFCESATIKCKLGCSLRPREGSFSAPVANLSMLPRVTKPLLPPKRKDEQIQKQKNCKMNILITFCYRIQL